MFERALVTPLIIMVPGKIKNGEQVVNGVSYIDIYPTLMELCGVEMPFKTDERSLVGLIEKPTLQNWEEASYGYYMNGISLRTERCRQSKFFRKELPVLQLYDHLKDPFENINIAAEQKDIVDSLLPILDKWNTGLYNK